jgi:hypothetical protein
MITFCKSTRRAGVLTAVLVIASCINSVAEAASITAPVGSQPGSGAAYTFVGANDGNVWLNTNSGGTWHWQDLVALNVSFGVGATAPGGSPAAYAVGVDGNLYIIHQVGSSWSTQNIGTPSAVALRKSVGVISNTSDQPFVFLIGSDGNLWLAHNAGSWTWRNLGTPSGVALSKPVGAVNIPGSYPQIFIIGSDGNLWVSQWNGSSYPWSLLGRPNGYQLTTGMFAWQQGNLPYGFVGTASNGAWYAHQLSSGGAWQWTSLPASATQLPVGLALNDDIAIAAFDSLSLTRIAVNDPCPAPHINCAVNLNDTYAIMTPVGVADTGDGEGPYAFAINTSGHLEVIYGSSGNLGDANAIDLGTPP